MQIVIDISSYDKEWITNGYYIPKEINMKISEAIVNGTPLDEVLDKIRAEIEALPRELPTDARNMVRRTRVLDIIDKYRGEADEISN